MPENGDEEFAAGGCVGVGGLVASDGDRDMVATGAVADGN